MNVSGGPREEEAFRAAFSTLQHWVRELKAKRGLATPDLPATRGRQDVLSVADINQLKADLSELIQSEGRKSFWFGLITNSVFFALGLVTSQTFDLIGRIWNWIS